VMKIFRVSPLGERFYLAGGTALALQLGHRQSYDLDYFSPTEDIVSLRDSLRDVLQVFQPILSDSSWGNLVFLAAGVRVGFYGYGYPLVAPFVLAEGVNLASLQDIGLMKMDALLSRASRKDFHDLYAIGQHIPLRSLFALAGKKYLGMRDFEAQVGKRLVYFARAEQEEPPPLLQEVPWGAVKAYFRQEVKSLAKSWLV
jgi:hypothetical protein